MGSQRKKVEGLRTAGVSLPHVQWVGGDTFVPSSFDRLECTVEFGPQFLSSPVDPAAYRSDRAIGQCGNLFVRQSLDFFKNEGGPVILPQFIEGLTQQLLIFGGLQGSGGV